VQIKSFLTPTISVSGNLPICKAGKEGAEVSAMTASATQKTGKLPMVEAHYTLYTNPNAIYY